MISSGKMGANSSGPTGSLVAGLRGGSNWKGKSGIKLYQLSGNELSSSINFVDSIPGLLFLPPDVYQLTGSCVEGQTLPASSPGFSPLPSPVPSSGFTRHPSRLTSLGIRAPETGGSEAARASRALVRL